MKIREITMSTIAIGAVGFFAGTKRKRINLLMKINSDKERSEALAFANSFADFRQRL